MPFSSSRPTVHRRSSTARSSCARITIACTKRPITPEKIDGLITSIEAELRSSQCNEIKSRDLGDLVLARLATLDDVALLSASPASTRISRTWRSSPAPWKELTHGRSFQAARRDPGSARLRPSGRCLICAAAEGGTLLPFERALVPCGIALPFPRAMRGSSFPEAAWRHDRASPS
ncbi:MAG: ATP cone domain-containing protein [Adlercreutzia equolifaciens]